MESPTSLWTWTNFWWTARMLSSTRSKQVRGPFVFPVWIDIRWLRTGSQPYYIIKYSTVLQTIFHAQWNKKYIITTSFVSPGLRRKAVYNAILSLHKPAEKYYNKCRIWCKNIVFTTPKLYTYIKQKYWVENSHKIYVHT